MVQIRRDGDVPLHFEAAPLKLRVAVVSWPVAIVACAAGIGLFVGAGTPVVEAVAVAFVVVGGSLLMALVRCRRYEITVNRRMVELRLGPFRHTLPAGVVEAVETGPAKSWRRLFGDREAALILGIEARSVIVPTNDGEELRSALLHE